jgi:hypothetical protein
VSRTESDANTDPTLATVNDVKVSNSLTINSQSTESSGDTTAHQPGERKRKRDKVGSALRKMLPGAGFIAGLAFVGERIWEIVENVS